MGCSQGGCREALGCCAGCRIGRMAVGAAAGPSVRSRAAPVSAVPVEPGGGPLKHCFSSRQADLSCIKLIYDPNSVNETRLPNV